MVQLELCWPCRHATVIGTQDPDMAMRAVMMHWQAELLVGRCSVSNRGSTNTDSLVVPGSWNACCVGRHA